MIMSRKRKGGGVWRRRRQQNKVEWKGTMIRSMKRE
jgi:hypothetical protein